MKKFHTVLIFLFISGFISAQEKNYEKNQLLVQMAAGKSIEEVIFAYKQLNGAETEIKIEKRVSRHNRIWLLNFNEDKFNIDRMIRELQNDKNIEIIQKNHSIHFRDTIPDDPNFSQQWQHKNNGGGGGIAGADMRASSAWDIATGGITSSEDTIVIAIVDDGINLNHPDFGDNIWINHHEIPNNGIDDDGNGFIDDVRGWNFQNNNNNVSGGWHGTQVAGCAGAKGNNATGVSGVNWNVKLMFIIYGSIGTVSNPNEANVIAAYDYALGMRIKYNQTNGDSGAFVVATNSSWGIDKGQPANAPLWCAFYDTLGKYGILNVAATANQNWDIDSLGDLPTACPGDYMLAVTNTTKSDTRNSSSGYGVTAIDLGAPGTDVYTTQQGGFGGFYGTTTGTSFSSPHVAGTVGLLYSVPCPAFIDIIKNYPDSASLLIRKFILEGVDTISALQGKTVTGGRLNIYGSIIKYLDFCETIDTTKSNTSIKDFASGNRIFSVFPNPSDGKFTIYSLGQNSKITVYNLPGNIIYQSTITHQTSVDFSGKPKGIYFVSVQKEDGTVETKKLVISE